MKNFSRLISRNPLKRLEFGRENPRKSKKFQGSKAGGFKAKRRRAKKIQICRPASRRQGERQLIYRYNTHFEAAHRQGWAAADFCSCASIADASTKVRPMSSRPSIRHCLRNGSISNLTIPPSGPRISCAGRSTVSVAFAPRSASSWSLARSCGRDPDRQDAVLEAIVVEDVGEVGRDHAADAEVEQRPGRVLTRRAAAEIVARDDDCRLAVGRLVEDEVGVLGAILAIAHFGEEALAEAGALDRLEILLGDDHVGVDIVDRHRRRDSGQCRKLVHWSDFLLIHAFVCGRL